MAANSGGQLTVALFLWSPCELLPQSLPGIHRRHGFGSMSLTAADNLCEGTVLRAGYRNPFLHTAHSQSGLSLEPNGVGTHT